VYLDMEDDKGAWSLARCDFWSLPSGLTSSVYSILKASIGSFIDCPGPDSLLEYTYFSHSVIHDTKTPGRYPI
jgi:hypothetical protein